MQDRKVRIVSEGGVGRGTKVIDATTGEALGLGDLRVRAITIPRFDSDSPIIAHLEVFVDELDVAARGEPTLSDDLLKKVADDEAEAIALEADKNAATCDMACSDRRNEGRFDRAEIWGEKAESYRNLAAAIRARKTSRG